MDQDSFRQLLQKPSAASPPSNTAAHVRGSLLATATAGKKKAKTVDASQPAFKPRTLKKGAKGEAYRDRATERRLGTNNDYAQVEALAEDFERRAAENADRLAVEEQRKYLGGDSQHTVLVKGLDFALLEQNRARAAAEAAVTEDVFLEQAFEESSAQPKKRTREEILRDLKSKRGTTSASAAQPSVADKALEEAKKAGKFKPIGFKPVGSISTGDGKVKRKKKVKAGEVEENGERKKKRKVTTETSAGPAAAAPPVSATSIQEERSIAGPSAVPPSKPPPAGEPEPEPVDEDFDIFADAGEYTGVDLGDDDEASDDEGATRPSERKPQDEEDGEVHDSGPLRPGKWLATSDDEREPTSPPSPAREGTSTARSESPQRRPEVPLHPPSDEEDGEMEEERPIRLHPLSSSAIPSIKELLAASEEAEKAKKRKAKKDKKKAGGGEGVSGEKDIKAKVDRDYQRLKAYQEKKNAA
ncbi:RED-like protein N-terminal region-domain-containing protein [Dichomitus squalens]|uniref:RED-like protein N-terminal region-domain-containing protein n=1 Tax=Dichomitus squalens TaxID=114155 RepID=A0A4Q9MIP4_9APHY|nr:RED-like protein N-terminal region-domain-containing protein [Dichomitus squalens]